MTKAPRLSICIATYNRANFIAETLESIIPQLTDEIELLIVDGASTDNTEHVLSGYVLKEDRLRYVRLKEKGGVDKDYCVAVKLARGDYCWLFTDDDLLKCGAIDAVINKLADDVSLVIVNAEVSNSDFTEIITDRVVNIHDDILYSSDEFESLFIDTVKYMTFIGSVVIKRQLWLEREQECYWGSEFIHLGVIFQEPLFAKACLIAKPYISIRYGNAQWSRRSFEIWMFKWPRIIWSLDKISQKARRGVISKEPWRNLSTLLLRRALGDYSLSEFHKYIKKEQTNLLWRFAAVSIAMLPFRINNKLFEVYYSLNKEHSKLFMCDLAMAKKRRLSCN